MMGCIMKVTPALCGTDVAELGIDVRFAALGMKLLEPIDGGAFDRQTKALAHALEQWVAELETRCAASELRWSEPLEAGAVAESSAAGDRAAFAGTGRMEPGDGARTIWVDRIVGLLPPHVRDLIVRGR